MSDNLPPWPPRIPNETLEEYHRRTGRGSLADKIKSLIKPRTASMKPRTASMKPENAWDLIYNTDLGKDIMSGASGDVYVGDYIADNIGTDVVIIRFIGDDVHGNAVSRRTIMIDKDSLKHLLSDSIIYPCIEANGLIGRNVIRDRPLYSLKMLETMGAVEKPNLDSLLAQDGAFNGNLFLLIRYAHETFVTVASNQILNNENLNDAGEVTWVSGIHCGAGVEPVKLYFAVSVDYIQPPPPPSRPPPSRPPPSRPPPSRLSIEIDAIRPIPIDASCLIVQTDIRNIESYTKSKLNMLLESLTPILLSISELNWSRLRNDYEAYLTKIQLLTRAEFALKKYTKIQVGFNKLHPTKDEIRVAHERLLLIYNCLFSIMKRSLSNRGGGKQTKKSKKYRKTKLKKNKSKKSSL